MTCKEHVKAASEGLTLRNVKKINFWGFWDFFDQNAYHISRRFLNGRRKRASFSENGH
jgi:hypothetical protein